MGAFPPSNTFRFHKFRRDFKIKNEEFHWMQKLNGIPDPESFSAYPPILLSFSPCCINDLLQLRGPSSSIANKTTQIRIRGFTQKSSANNKKKKSRRESYKREKKKSYTREKKWKKFKQTGTPTQSWEKPNQGPSSVIHKCFCILYQEAEELQY